MLEDGSCAACPAHSFREGSEGRAKRRERALVWTIAWELISGGASRSWWRVGAWKKSMRAGGDMRAGEAASKAAAGGRQHRRGLCGRAEGWAGAEVVRVCAETLENLG